MVRLYDYMAPGRSPGAALAMAAADIARRGSGETLEMPDEIVRIVDSITIPANVALHIPRNGGIQATGTLLVLGRVMTESVAPFSGNVQTSVAVAARSSEYPAAVLADDPLAYWRMGGPGGVVPDETGHGHDATPIGGITYEQTGALLDDSSTSVLLNGTTGYFDTTLVANPASYAGFAVEAWANPRVLTSGNDQLVVQRGGTGTGRGWLFAEEAADVWQTNVGGTGLAGYGALVGIWAHLVASLSGTTVSLYVDGELANSGTRTVEAANGIWRIGASNALSPLLWWNGRIQEVAIYAHALSAARVLAHYDAGRNN